MEEQEKKKKIGKWKGDDLYSIRALYRGLKSVFYMNLGTRSFLIKRRIGSEKGNHRTGRHTGAIIEEEEEEEKKKKGGLESMGFTLLRQESSREQ
jgi:hypothetical protein